MTHPYQWRISFPILVLILGLLLPGPDAVAAQYQVEFSGEPQCQGCRIEIVERVDLGSPDDEVFGAEGLPRVAVDGRGRAYVISDLRPTASVPIYDVSSGALVGTIGREGQGPGEFGRVWRIAAGEAEVYVQDVSGRLHVFDSGGSFQRQLNELPSPLHHLSMVGDTVILTVGSAGGRAGGADRSVHAFHADAGHLLVGLGPSMGSFGVEDPSAISRAAAGSGESVWLVVSPDRIFEWSLHDEAVGVMSWDSDWLRHVSGRYEGMDAQRYVLHDVWLDDPADVLWILSVVDDPAHGEGLDPAPGQPMDPDRYSPSAMNERKQSILTAIDLGGPRVLTHRELDVAGYGFTEDGRLVVMDEADFHRWVELWTVALNGRSGERD